MHNESWGGRDMIHLPMNAEATPSIPFYVPVHESPLECDLERSRSSSSVRKLSFRGSRGFTLIELLVVIAIIAVLAALVFPAYSSVQAKSQQTKCSAQLRQWGVAIIGYAGDHKGMVRWDNWESVGIGTHYYEPYFGEKSIGLSNGKSASSQSFFRMCPSTKWDGTGNPPTTYLFMRPRELQDDGSYKTVTGVDTDGDNTADSYSMFNAVRPSQLLWMMDCISGGSASAPSKLKTAVKPVCDPGVNQRHGGGVNALFGDGHMESLTWAAIDYGVTANQAKLDTWFNLN